MKKLLELQRQYIEALRRSTAKPIELLEAAKYSLSNHISDCRMEGCTTEKRCNFCTAWTKVWDDIDAYLEDNE